MKRPTPDQMRLAADWLESNDGEGGESQNCAAVAAWLNCEAANEELRALARQHGVKVKSLRTRLQTNTPCTPTTSS